MPSRLLRGVRSRARVAGVDCCNGFSGPSWEDEARGRPGSHPTSTRMSTITGAAGRASGTRSGRTRTRTTAQSTQCSNPPPKACGPCGSRWPGWTPPRSRSQWWSCCRGSVALLGDALHNSADALTAVPLGIAFLLSRRRPTRRYTYGYGRAELADRRRGGGAPPRPRPRSPPSAGCCTRTWSPT